MSDDGASIERIVEHLQRGSRREENARLLFEHYSPRVYSFFRKQTGSDEDSCELTQEVFKRFFEGIGDFRNEASLNTWLFSVTTNVWRNWRRDLSALKRTARVIAIDATGDDPCSAAMEIRDPEDSVLQRLLLEERAQKLREAVQELPPQMRRCVFLSIDQDLKYREIAIILRTTEGNVKYHMHQARQRLKEALAGYFDTIEL